MNWNTNQVKAALESKGFNVKVGIPAGDYDTEGLTISHKNVPEYEFYARGFVVDEEMTNPTDNYVQFVELTDGMCSSGGCNSKLRQEAGAFLDAQFALIDMGFTVEDSYDPFF